MATVHVRLITLPCPFPPQLSRLLSLSFLSRNQVSLPTGPTFTAGSETSHQPSGEVTYQIIRPSDPLQPSRATSPSLAAWAPLSEHAMPSVDTQPAGPSPLDDHPNAIIPGQPLYPEVPRYPTVPFASTPALPMSPSRNYPEMPPRAPSAAGFGSPTPTFTGTISYPPTPQPFNNAYPKTSTVTTFGGTPPSRRQSLQSATSFNSGHSYSQWRLPGGAYYPAAPPSYSGYAGYPSNAAAPTYPSNVNMSTGYPSTVTTSYPTSFHAPVQSIDITQRVPTLAEAYSAATHVSTGSAAGTASDAGTLFSDTSSSLVFVQSAPSVSSVPQPWISLGTGVPGLALPNVLMTRRLTS